MSFASSLPPPFPLRSTLRYPPVSLALPAPTSLGLYPLCPSPDKCPAPQGSPPAALPPRRPAQSLPTYCEEQLRPPVHKSQVQVTLRAQRIRALPRSSPWEPESLSPRFYVLKKLFWKQSKRCKEGGSTSSGTTRGFTQGLLSSLLLASQA